MALRVVFMGTPAFAVPTLETILGGGHTVVAVYSQPARPAGRGMSETRTPVHAFAASHAIPVRTPLSLKSLEEQAAFAALDADVAVVVAYGLVLPKAILASPRFGCLNLHASALPRWRGAAPIQRAIMAGDTETAVMVMRMEAGLDAGPVGLAERLAIGPNETAGGLQDRLATAGAPLMARALSDLESGTLAPTPQPDGGITYASKIAKAEARIDWSQPASNVHNLIRGLSPFPGAWFEAGPLAKRERIKVLRSELAAGAGEPGRVLDGNLTIACGVGAVRLLEVQRAGKKPALAAEFLRGFNLVAGERAA